MRDQVIHEALRNGDSVGVGELLVQPVLDRVDLRTLSWHLF